MATGTEWNCPICRDTGREVARVTPCLHLFCLGCIVRWAKRNPSCPLCRQAVNSIFFSMRSEGDFLEIVLPRPLDPQVADHQEEQGAAEQVPANVAGFPPELWAQFFQESTEILEPLLPWLDQELSVLFRARWWEEALAQSTVIANLCRHGLSKEALARELQPLLQDHTGAFVHQLVEVAADRCSDQILRQMDLLDPHSDEEQEDSPTATPGASASHEGTPSSSPASSCSPQVSSAEQDTSTLEATLHGGPGHSPSLPVSAEQEEPQDDTPAVAGPSGQGCTHSPSAPHQDRDCLPGEPRCPQKRRASGPQDAPQPCKRLSHW